MTLKNIDQILEVIRLSGFFDEQFYCRENPDVEAGGLDPIEHYLAVGAAHGRDPSPTFSTNHYLRWHKHFLPAGKNPFLDFIESKQSRAEWLEELLLRVLPTSPKASTIKIVLQEGVFNDEWYLSHNPDVKTAGMDGLLHFMLSGHIEGRNPSASFPVLAYAWRYRRTLESGVNPIVDYVLNKESRSLQFTHDELIDFNLALHWSRAEDSSLDPTLRLRSASHLMSYSRLEYERLSKVFVSLSQFPSASREARKMEIICRRLKGLAAHTLMEPYREVDAPSLRHPPTEDTQVAAESVLILRKPGAQKLIFIFTGNDQQIWIPIQIFQSFLPSDAHVIYLKDPTLFGHIFGLSALGFGYANTLRGLKRLAKDLDAKEIYCIGSSSGGYSALRFGFDLCARRVIAFVPKTDMTNFCTRQKEIEAFIGVSLEGAWPPEPLDLRQCYTSREYVPETTIVFGSDHAEDAEPARHMEGCPNVKLIEIAGYAQHNVVSELLLDGRLEPLLGELTKEVTKSS